MDDRPAIELRGGSSKQLFSAALNTGAFEWAAQFYLLREH